MLQGRARQSQVPRATFILLGLHMRLPLLCPLKWLLRLPLTSSAGALELRFSDFMKWENTEIQEFHRVRKTWPGKVTFPSSKHPSAPLGLRSDTWQRFLLPAGLERGHGDTYPAQIWGQAGSAGNPSPRWLQGHTAELSQGSLSQLCCSFWGGTRAAGFVPGVCLCLALCSLHSSDTRLVLGEPSVSPQGAGMEAAGPVR